ncbi:hypothetical protein BLOT_014884 [Blomia tropicalis]|nr:hypothetical protein BLOT_014884 [Blomia tropicalis]
MIEKNNKKNKTKKDGNPQTSTRINVAPYHWIPMLTSLETMCQYCTEWKNIYPFLFVAVAKCGLWLSFPHYID